MAIKKAFGGSHLVPKEPKEYFPNMPWFYSITSIAFKKQKLILSQMLLCGDIE